MPRPRSDIRARVLEVALEAFLRQGVDGAPLRAIARQAGTNIGMIYYYFPTKDDLFLAVVETAYEGVLARLREALGTDGPFEERVQSLFRFFAGLDEHELTVARLILREALASHDRMEKIVARFMRGHMPLLVGLVGQGFREGVLPRDQNPFIALACLAGIGIVPQVLVQVGEGRLPQLGVELPDPNTLPDELQQLYLRALGAADPNAEAGEG